MKNLSRLGPAPRPRTAGVDGHRTPSQDDATTAGEPVGSPIGLGLARRLAADRRHLAGMALGIIGLAISIYLSATKLAPQDVTLYCSVASPLNCQQVTSSPQSMIAGIPVPVLGVAWFAGWLGLMALTLWSTSSQLLTARLVWTIGGVGFVGYLVYSELFLIGSICEWCTTTHVIALSLFGLTLWEALDRRKGRQAAQS